MPDRSTESRHATAPGKLVGRPASGVGDLRAAGALITRAWLGNSPLVTWTPGDLSWWFAQAWPADIGKHLQLWEQDGRLVAWSWHETDDSEGPAELEYHAWSGDAALDAAFGRQILEASLGDGALEVWTAEDDKERIALLERNGFVHLVPGMAGATGHLLSSQYQRTLEGPVPSAELPPGYQIRSLRGPEDIERRVEVHRAAFAPSRMSVQKYERLVTLPLYRFEDDLVVEASDGRFAAFTMAWWDSVARIGEFEPVGTHPDHQRRGLGKALLSHALRRYGALGAERVQVRSSASNVASEALYRSVGFERRAYHQRYRHPGS
jgi:ribosomal protein S18 acetylase RimI-like enzyme